MKTTVNLRNLACLTFLLALVLTLASCGREPHYPRQLLVADSLTNVNRPHDADSLLRSYRDTAMKAAEPIRMYYQLLRMRTDDKLNIIPKNDSLALVLVDYYEHKGDKRLLPKAYYYAGRTYKELYDEPQALAYFYNAIDVLHDENDITIFSKAYSQVGQLFQSQHLYDRAIPYFRKSLQSDISEHDTLGMIYNYRDIAFQYDKMRNDSAIYYYNKALRLAESNEIIDMQQSVSMCLSSFLLMKKQIKDAYRYIQLPLFHTDKAEMGSTYIVAGKIYDDLGMADSAIYYYRRVLEIGNCYAKESAAWRMAGIEQKRGNVVETIKYLEEYRRQNDSVKAINHAEAVVHAQAMYNYQLQEKARAKAEKSNAQKKLMIIILISLLIISLLLLFSIIKYNEKRKAVSMLRLQELNRIMKKKEEENLLYIANNNKRIECLNRELDKVQNELDKSRIENEKLILQAANIKARNALESKDISVMKIRNSQIFAKMREHLLKGFSARDEDFNEIELLVNRVFPTFTSNLTKLIDMSVQDYRVCLLLKCGFKPLEISTLTIHSPQSVSTTRSRLFKKCFGKKGSPGEWDSFITQFE